MTQPIDTAYVQIDARTQDFSRDLNRDVEKAYDKVDRQTEVLSRKITTSFDEAGREIKRTFTSISKEGVVTTRVVEEAFDEVGDSIQRAFRFATKDAVAAEELIAEVGRLAADTTADAWERAGERIEDAFREAERVAAVQMALMAAEAEAAERRLNDRFFKRLQTGFQDVGKLIIRLGEGLSDFVGSVITSGGFTKLLAILGAIVALTGPVIALGGALVDLVGLLGPLPAAFGVLLAAITPLIFAFQGLGDAIKAVNDGDPEKIAEAMKKLSPAARSIVREITGLNKVFDTFRKNVQQSFFAPIVGDIGSTVRILLPALQKSIDNVGGALGRLAENFLAFLQQTTTIKALNTLFNSTAGIIEAINVPLVNLFDTFLKLTVAGLPFIKRFTEAFGGLLEKFGAFIDESLQTGAFNDFVEDAIATTKELFDLLGALGRLIGALFGNADDEGRDFIQTLTDGVNALSDFFESAEGQRTIQDLVDSIKGSIFVIKLLVGGVRLAIESFHFMADMWKFVGQKISEGAQAIGRFFTDLGDKIGDFVGRVVDWFRALPERIMAFIRSIPGLILDLFNFLFDELNRRIGIGIGLIIFTFTELPKRVIAAVQALPELLGDIFSAAWNFAQQKTIAGINAVIAFVRSIPGRIGALASSVGAAVANFFSRVFAGGKTQASNAVDSIIGFIRKLPSRLGSFVNDVGGRIGDAIKRVLNRAISKINDGIAQVDKFLPGDLPRIPQLAEGGIVKKRPGGVIAQIAEGGQDEVVAPLDKLMKAIEDRDGTNITFGPGSVAVTFEGVVPTEADARRTGNAVGLGILDVLSKRDIRTTVRAM